MSAEYLSGSIAVQPKFTLGQPFTGLSDSHNPTSLSKQVSWTTTGAGANAIDQVYAALLSIAASGTASVTLASGLTDVLNNAVAFVRCKGYAVFNLANNDPSGLGALATSVTFNGLNGTAVQGGFTAGTSPIQRVFNGGFTSVGNPNATGSTQNLAITVTNEDSVNAAAVLVVFFGSKE